MKEIEFISSGVMTTIQDLGRKKWRNMGVPLSGAADPESAALANALLRKNVNSAVLESTFVGPKFKLHVSQDIALAGAIMELKIFFIELIRKGGFKLNSSEFPDYEHLLTLRPKSGINISLN